MDNKQVIEFQSGFTLVELLVVITVVISVTVVAGNIFYSSLRSNTKTQVSTNLKQKGNYALTIMERMIREAKIINEADCTDDELTITYKDGEETTFICDTTLPEPDQVASVSAQHPAVLIDSINCENFSFSCDLPRVDIEFTLSHNPNDPLPFNRAEVKFQTSVTARNL